MFEGAYTLLNMQATKRWDFTSVFKVNEVPSTVVLSSLSRNQDSRVIFAFRLINLRLQQSRCETGLRGSNKLHSYVHRTSLFLNVVEAALWIPTQHGHLDRRL